jgi:solute carrier family 36 (proton-coupled amino acid transporter)
MKHSGLILGPILTICLSAVCINQQHVLINCSEELRHEYGLDKRLDYAETLELSLTASEKWRKYAKAMKRICNIFLIVTQLGFCAVYFLFVGNNVKNIFDFYGLECNINILMIFTLIPIIPTSLITNLRYLGECKRTRLFSSVYQLIFLCFSAPFSGVANLCMFFGITVTFWYSAHDLPSLSERRLVTSSLHELPLFFGTAIYLFEGIGLVLPLKNSMKNPRMFSNSYGVLNVGMIFLTTLFTLLGFVGYWKYGEDVESSLTLNLPPDKW